MKRNSSIEMLKIIAIVIIVLSHSLPYGVYNNYNNFINLRMCTTSTTNLLLSIVRYLGNIGNCIFIICSSYFLLESKKIKCEKIINLMIKSFLVSITMLVLFRFVLKIGTDLTIKNIIQMIMPITFQLNWYISCYIILYLIHPLLNAAIESLNEKYHLYYLIFFVLVYSIINSIKDGILFYNHLIGFIMIYFVVAYLKKYKNEICKNQLLNIKIFVGSLFLLLTTIIIINYTGLKISFFSNKLQYLNSFNNPLIILMCISLFNIFNNKSFYNNKINYFSSLSLLIYIIHGNPFIVGYLKGYYFDSITFKLNASPIIYSILLFFIFIIGSTVLSMIIDYIEKSIKKSTQKD